MEELDLNVLAAELNRSMTQSSNMIHNAQIPAVVVLVKVPHIAFKYPMANGQFRRFQVKFTCDEDYDEAMKMLSRANVPTVASGSFPTQPKPHHAASANQLTPHDSASQRGFSSNASTTYEQQHNSVSVTNTSNRISCPSLSAQVSMAPPTFAASALGNPQCDPSKPTSLHDQLLPSLSHRRQPAGPHSHGSLSTATTLVNNRDRPGIHNPRGRQDMDNLLPTARPQGKNNYANAPRGSTVDHEFNLGLPPRRNLPFPSVSTLPNQVHSAAIPQANVSDDQPRTSAVPTTTSNSTRNEAIPPPSPGVTGKRKRVAPKSTTEAAGAKKPRAPAKSKKTASRRTAEGDRPVPTVEELLKQPEPIITRRLTRAMSITSAQNDKANNPPQTPLPVPKSNGAEVPESANPAHDDTGRCPSLSLGSPSRRHTLRSASRVLSTLEIQTGTTRPQTTTIAAADTLANDEGERIRDRDTYPCTPADQIIDVCTPASPSVPHLEPMVIRNAVDNTTNTAADDPQGPPPPPIDHLGNLGLDTNVNMAMASSTTSTNNHPTNNNNNPRAEPEPAGTAAPADRAVNHDDTLAGEFLFADPTSAQALAEIDDWSRLPPAQRRSVLRSHLASLIMQPSFLSLCRDLSAMWETEILMGKIANM
ncbi:hypothetical protein LTS17_001880 [Exophiala oligosperma]